MKRLIVVVALAVAAGCIDRTRVNERCEWFPEVVSPNLSERLFADHLHRDIELAVELAVRYADTVAQQRSGYKGHGGLIDGGRLRDECMATLLSAIAETHDVPLSRVVAARSDGYRPVAWDAIVLLLYTVLYGCSSLLIARLLSRRFPADEGWAAVAAPAVVSPGIGAMGVMVFQLWAMTLEIVRLGNGHLSGYRADWNPWLEHIAILYVGGVLLFLMIAAFNARGAIGRTAPISR